MLPNADNEQKNTKEKLKVMQLFEVIKLCAFAFDANIEGDKAGYGIAGFLKDKKKLKQKLINCGKTSVEQKIDLSKTNSGVTIIIIFIRSVRAHMRVGISCCAAAPRSQSQVSLPRIVYRTQCHIQRLRNICGTIADSAEIAGWCSAICWAYTHTQASTSDQWSQQAWNGMLFMDETLSRSDGHLREWRKDGT